MAPRFDSAEAAELKEKSKGEEKINATGLHLP
jgi:hypothetical protein